MHDQTPNRCMRHTCEWLVEVFVIDILFVSCSLTCPHLWTFDLWFPILVPETAFPTRSVYHTCIVFKLWSVVLVPSYSPSVYWPAVSEILFELLKQCIAFVFRHQPGSCTCLNLFVESFSLYHILTLIGLFYLQNPGIARCFHWSLLFLLTQYIALTSNPELQTTQDISCDCKFGTLYNISFTFYPNKINMQSSRSLLSLSHSEPCWEWPTTV